MHAEPTQAIGKLVDAAQTGKADLRCLLNECVESDPRSSDSSRVQAHESLLNVLRDACFEVCTALHSLTHNSGQSLTRSHSGGQSLDT